MDDEEIGDGEGVSPELREWVHESLAEFREDLDRDYESQLMELVGVFEEKGPPPESEGRDTAFGPVHDDGASPP